MVGKIYCAFFFEKAEILGTLAGAGKFGLAGSGLAEAEAEAGKGVFFRPHASEETGIILET